MASFTAKNRRTNNESRKARQIFGWDDSGTSTTSRKSSNKKQPSFSLMLTGSTMMKAAESSTMSSASASDVSVSDVCGNDTFPQFQNLDSLFSGKVYEPNPIVLSDPYAGGTCKPVPISEVAMKMTEDIRHATHNTSHEGQAFYHGELSREGAIRLFHNYGSQPGLCVVRDSTRTPGHYALTVWEGKSAVNYRIEFCVRNGIGFYLLSGKTPFKSIGEILLFLNRNSQHFPTAPHTYIPCIPDDVKDSLYSKRFVPNNE